MEETQHGDSCNGPSFGCRHVQVIFYFLLMTFAYCMRTVLSVAIVAMNDNTTSVNTDLETYHWQDQPVVLSAFFWGYVILQIPAAQLSKKIGAKWMLVGCTTTDSVSCILIPTMAGRFGSSGVIGCRIVQGLAQGSVAPMIHSLLGCWAPVKERSVLGTVAYAGSIVGNIFSLLITGFICSSSLGWPAAFYLFGCLGLTWVLAWMFIGADTPNTHQNITDCERKYIQNSLGQQDNKVLKTPWKAILSSTSFWAVTIAFVGANWGSSVLLTQTPTYLYRILGYDIKANSLLSAAPYMAMLMGSLLFSPICDWLINQKILSRDAARKIFNSIGTILPAISLTLLGFIPKHHTGFTIALLILNGAFTAGGFCSYQINHMDLSPNHSGALMAITNSSTSIFSIISPLIVQFIVTDQDNPSQWRTIFIITASVYLSANTFYIIFGSGRIQPWNDIQNNNEIDQANKTLSTIKTECS